MKRLALIDKFPRVYGLLQQYDTAEDTTPIFEALRNLACDLEAEIQGSDPAHQAGSLVYRFLPAPAARYLRWNSCPSAGERKMSKCGANWSRDGKDTFSCSICPAVELSQCRRYKDVPAPEQSCRGNSGGVCSDPAECAEHRLCARDETAKRLQECAGPAREAGQTFSRTAAQHDSLRWRYLLTRYPVEILKMLSDDYDDLDDKTLSEAVDCIIERDQGGPVRIVPDREAGAQDELAIVEPLYQEALRGETDGWKQFTNAAFLAWPKMRDAILSRPPAQGVPVAWAVCATPLHPPWTATIGIAEKAVFEKAGYTLKPLIYAHPPQPSEDGV